MDIDENLDMLNSTKAPVENGPYWIIHLGIMVPVCCWIMLANSLTLMAIRINKQLQTKTHMLVASLAVVDLSVGAVMMMESILFSYYILRKSLAVDIKGPLLCLTLLALWIPPVANSFNHLVMIAVDRYIAVLYPLRYEQMITRGRLKVFIGCSWLESYVQGGLMFLCWDNFDPTCSKGLLEIPISYAIPLMATPSFACTFALIFFYSKIMIVAHAQQVRIHAIQRMESDLSGDQRPMIPLSVLKLVKMFALIVGVFFICVMPMITYLMLAWIFGPHHMSFQMLHPFQMAMGILLLSNSGMNFVIYVTKDKIFKMTILRILRCNSVNVTENSQNET